MAGVLGRVTGGADSERRLVAALLLLACLDAHKGDAEALVWLAGEESATWAGLIGLDARWPPALAMLAGRRELQARARELEAPLQP